jgi:glycosyltransferase involved in cell wall biosynthesis
MRITFLLPCYVWAPSGGPRVVYEYANRLVSRGHEVSIVHPRRLVPAPTREPLTAYRWARKAMLGLRERISQPTLDWQPIDKRVRMMFTPSSDFCHLPDGDAIFATAWHTVDSVLRSPREKGEKCYFIQHYEVWQGPKDLVDATWRAPLHKVVIAKWLMDLGRSLGCENIAYIPNSINHEIYRLAKPLENRPRQVAMMFSREEFKGSTYGIQALDIVKRKFPDLKAVFFSTSRRDESIPQWVEYHRSPPLNYIVNEIYGRSSIFLSPSLAEGWPLPPAEAAACGCAVVSAGNGGVMEYVHDGVTGLLSPIKDAESLAENICRLFRDETLRLKLAKSCHDLVSGLDWEKSTDLLESFIREVTRERTSLYLS